MALFMLTDQQWVSEWDTGEFQVCTWILGVMHPTGFPLYTLIGWMFSHIPIAPIPARTGFLSGLCMSLTTLVGYAVARRLGGSPWISALALVIFACGDVVWITSIRADVHAMVTLFDVAAVGSAIAFAQTAQRRWLWSAALFIGLGLATHLVALWAVLPVIALIVSRHREVRWPEYARAAALAASGALWYAYLPLRSAYIVHAHLDPAAALGLFGSAYWNYANPSTLGGFLTLTLGHEFDKTAALLATVDVVHLPQHVSDLLALAWIQYSWPILLSAAIGCILALRRTPLITWALIAYALMTAFFVLEYGVEAFRDRYFLPAYWVLAIFAALGASWTANRFHLKSTRHAVPVAFVSVVLVLVMAHRDRFAPHVSGYPAQRDAALKVTPDDAVIIAPWLRGSSLSYAANVDRVLGRRIVIIGSAESYAKNLPRWVRAHRRIFAWDVDRNFVLPGFHVVERLSPEPHVVEITR